eukprot:CAMPEP_0168328478 /NCGR_PEP_ID=MMETSP0213-20121227/6517_1 /TAXON_ID=151035 /ORGANISM="Euplotes harpa, Strain FSP1.4" /LENGTH=52 /DNA_ID=CAMNT_0008331581 /DNA_START=321 /DNA_END=482 /DNA_ORIENTATION=+
MTPTSAPLRPSLPVLSPLYAGRVYLGVVKAWVLVLCEPGLVLRVGRVRGMKE